MISPEEVSKTAVGILKDESVRQQIADRLKQIVGEPGAAQRLVGILQEVLSEND